MISDFKLNAPRHTIRYKERHSEASWERMSNANLTFAIDILYVSNWGIYVNYTLFLMFLSVSDRSKFVLFQNISFITDPLFIYLCRLGKAHTSTDLDKGPKNYQNMFFES